jgi:hypothetical protein
MVPVWGVFVFCLRSALEFKIMESFLSPIAYCFLDFLPFAISKFGISPFPIVSYLSGFVVWV